MSTHPLLHKATGRSPHRTSYRYAQLAQKLDKKLATWRPEVVAQVEQIVTDVIELADTDTLDLLPSRAVVQEVLDALDERQSG